MKTIERGPPDVAARRRMYAAIERALRGELAAAVRETHALLGESPGDPAVWMAAGALLFVGRAYPAGLAAFERAEACGGGGRALAMQYERAMRLGLVDEARRALEGHARYSNAEVPLPRPAPDARHAHDRADLLDAALLLRGRARAVDGAASGRAGLPATLTADEVAQFERHGYVVLRGALPRAVLDAWVARAHTRIAALIEARGGARYVRDDPSTWPTELVDCPSETLTPASECAPRIWGAACDLLGGPACVQPRSLSDYFVVRFPGVRNGHTDEGLSWHIDDPARVTQLRAIGTGVVALALCSDVAPGGGDTRLLPESIRHVAMALARGAGTPLDAAAVARIAARCSEVVRCTGEAGDVFVVHPLMAHSGSFNASPRVRWLSNWMFYPTAPLDPYRASVDALSPVERVVANRLADRTI